MKLFAKNQKMLKSLILVGLLIIAFASSVSFSYKYYGENEAALKMQSIASEMADIRGVMDFVSLRQHNIQKIIKIADQYNKDLSKEKKMQLASEIHDMCLKYTNLNVDLVCATITHESALTWKPDVISPVGALGLMQIMPETGKILAEVEGIKWTTAEDILFDPILNVRLGCRYLSDLIQQYEIDGGLAAYNGGEKRARLWLEKRNDKTDLSLLWEETQVYVPSILKLYAQYQTQTGIL